MEFGKVVSNSDFSISDVIINAKCGCGCNVCNSQKNPTASSDNGGEIESRINNSQRS